MPIQLLIWEPGDSGYTDQTRRLSRGQYASLNHDDLINERAKLDFVFQLRGTDSYEPTPGSPVMYYENDGVTNKRAYAGRVLTQAPRWFSNDNDRYVKVQCASLESLFDEILVRPAVYDGQTAAAIFRALVTPVVNEAPDLIMLGSIIGGLVIPKLSFNGTEYITDAIKQLITAMSNEGATNWAWGVVPYTEPLPSVYFRPPEALGITITGQPGEILWKTLEKDENGADLVNAVRISAGQDLFPPSCWCFIHPTPQSQTYTLPFIPDQITAARITWGRAPSVALAHLTALPLPGDTMTIGNATYTFVNDLDNGEQNQIKIGATFAATITNITAAINADPALGGIGFSWPTLENDLVNAEQPAPGNWYVWAKRAGKNGDLIGVTSTAAGVVFVGIDGFPASTLTGGNFPEPNGIAPQDIPLSPSNSTDTSNISQPTLLYQPGSKDITVLIPQLVGSPPVLGFSADPVPEFALLEVQYHRLGGASITLEDTELVAERRAIEHSSGRRQVSLTASNAADLGTLYQTGKKILAQQSKIPSTITFDSLRNFFNAADLLYFDTPRPTTTLNGRQWVIQEVRGAYVRGLDRVRNYTLKKTITAISGSLITKTQTWLDFSRGFVSQPSAPRIPQVATPAPQDSENILFEVQDSTVGVNRTPHAPLAYAVECRRVVITVKVPPTGVATTGVIHALYGSGSPVDTPLFPINIPLGSTVDQQILVDPADWLVPVPVILAGGVIPKLDIIGSDGVIDPAGVFSVRIDCVAAAGGQ